MSALAASPRAAHPLRGTRQPAPPVERTLEDRWIGIRSGRRASALMSLILVASVATHAGLVATAFWSDWRDREPPPKEISVEVVQEPAKPPPPKPQQQKPEAAAPPKASPTAKPEPAKKEQPKPEPPKAEQTKAESRKAEKPKPEASKPEAPKPEASKREASKAAKPEQKPQPQRISARKQALEARKEAPHHPSEANALRKQLDNLRAEHAALNAQQESLRPTLAKMTEPATAASSGSQRFRDLLGLPPASMGAVALPGESADGTETVSYKQLVLSKVAKAKKEGRYPGVPGFATIVFQIGDKGEVASTKIERAGGDASVSKEATDMIARGAPYPPPPPGADRMFVVTLEFRAAP